MEEVIARAIQNVTRAHVVVDAVVVNVDDALTDFVCDVQVGTGENTSTYYAVPIAVLIDQQASVIEIPNLNSNCLLMFRDGNIGRPQILKSDSIKQLLINCTGNNGVVFNGGKLGGLITISDLVTKLNNLENFCNELAGIYNSHTHEVVSVGSPTGPVVPLDENTLTLTKQSDIEDTTITH
jgi:hypothetical protein